MTPLVTSARESLARAQNLNDLRREKFIHQAAFLREHAFYRPARSIAKNDPVPADAEPVPASQFIGQRLDVALFLRKPKNPFPESAPRLRGQAGRKVHHLFLDGDPVVHSGSSLAG